MSDLVCQFAPGMGPNDGEREALRAALVSWKVTTRLHDPGSETRRRLYLRRWRRLGAEYAMQDFISLLDIIGKLVEDALCEQVAEDSDGLGVAMNVRIVVSLQNSMLERGRIRVAASFPTFSRLGRLAVISEDAGQSLRLPSFYTCFIGYLSFSTGYEWKDYDSADATETTRLG